MLHYPQLSTGAAVCYPLARTIVRRSIVNVLADGSSWKTADPDAQEVRWELRYAGLSDAERASLEAFHEECGGRLRTFTFFDPAGNLLAHSDDLSKSVWRVDGLVLTQGLRLTNGGQIWQGIEQTAGVPERFTSCFSAVVHGSGRVRLRAGSSESEYDAGPAPQTVWCTNTGGESDELDCRLDISAGSTVEVSALCLQAQPMPGAYRRTAQAPGIFGQTRFEDDVLTFTSYGPDDHSTTVRLRSRVAG